MEHLHRLLAKIDGSGPGFYTFKTDGTIDFSKGPALKRRSRR
jgi:hypothetical protein